MLSGEAAPSWLPVTDTRAKECRQNRRQTKRVFLKRIATQMEISSGERGRFSDGFRCFEI